MLKSLRDTVVEPAGTKSAIRQAIKSPAGLRLVWVVVEAEEDVKVYEKFMLPDSVIVKTSEDETGRKGYSNVEFIVREIKAEVPLTHIMGIRDADYSRFKSDFTVPVNIFLTDRRDLEMMLLESELVKQALRAWAPAYDEAFSKCVPICRHFGYLRIYNDVNEMSVKFHDNLHLNRYWNYREQAVVDSWEQDSTARFVTLSAGRCKEADVQAFITTQKLEDKSLYDVCRGHDLLQLLSLNLINVQIYSVSAIMNKMIEVYCLDDFKATHLYADILAWQTAEGVTALVA